MTDITLKFSKSELDAIEGALKHLLDAELLAENGYTDLDRDSKTQFYTLIKYRGTSDERECDICNTCLKKILVALKNERPNF